MQLIVRLLTKDDNTKSFDCGDEALTTYLRRYALKNQEKFLVGVTYVGISGEKADVVVGYYTLAAISIPTASASSPEQKRLSPYSEVPGVLLGRLGVDKRFQGRGIGQQLLKNALERCLVISRSAGCRCVIVDAYPQVVPWYAGFGFTPIAGHSSTSVHERMFLDLRTLQDVAQ